MPKFAKLFILVIFFSLLAGGIYYAKWYPPSGGVSQPVAKNFTKQGQVRLLSQRELELLSDEVVRQLAIDVAEDIFNVFRVSIEFYWPESEQKIDWMGLKSQCLSAIKNQKNADLRMKVQTLNVRADFKSATQQDMQTCIVFFNEMLNKSSPEVKERMKSFTPPLSLEAIIAKIKTPEFSQKLIGLDSDNIFLNKNFTSLLAAQFRSRQ